MNYFTHLQKGFLYSIRSILEEIEKKDLALNIFLTLNNRHEDSLISIRLKELYPDEMCISLSNNYRYLEVNGNYFQVQLNFNGLDELLRIPFSTIIKFEDIDENFVIDLTSIENLRKDDTHGFSIDSNIIYTDFDKKIT